MFRFSLFFLLLWIMACDSPKSSSVESIVPDSIPKIARTIALKKAPSKRPTCAIQGNSLEHNTLWLPHQSALVCITADSTTSDPKLGDSHRILSIYNASNCQRTLRLTLPINKSPDYPYFLADINYNHNSHILAIKGTDHIYCLDMDDKKMLPVLRPSFKSPRPTVDAQSGSIIHLELWENFLIGYAQDQGVFVFSIPANKIPKPILPYAEYKIGDTRYNSLFLLPSDNQLQAILPSYDWEEEKFSINPLFKKPTALKQSTIKKATNTPYIVIREGNSNKAIGVNLKKHVKVDLPEILQDKEVSTIVEWMAKQ